MAKVIVERPRRGGGAPFPLRSRPDCDRLSIEDWRVREGMRRPWLRTESKDLNENLAPLRRYLQSQTGRPWNKVYSEICERINRNSATQLHIWQHLIHYVCVDPHVTHGLVQNRWTDAEFIVDPKTGLLRENPRSWRRRRRIVPPPPHPDHVAVDSTRAYRRLDEIWYELRLAAAPANGIGYDYAMKRNVSDISIQTRYDFYGRNVYAISKRQLNKTEIRRLRLNDH